VLRKHKVKLAVENHKDWRAPELAAVLGELSTEWVGVTLDFGNSIALLEDPMEVVRTLVPFVLSTHVKDMAVEEYPEGFRLSEVPLGQGILDLPQIVALCRKHNPNVAFSLEMITRDPLEIPCLKPTTGLPSATCPAPNWPAPSAWCGNANSPPACPASRTSLPTNASPPKRPTSAPAWNGESNYE
jgi:hypothetical protein